VCYRAHVRRNSATFMSTLVCGCVGVRLRGYVGVWVCGCLATLLGTEDGLMVRLAAAFGGSLSGGAGRGGGKVRQAREDSSGWPGLQGTRLQSRRACDDPRYVKHVHESAQGDLSRVQHWLHVAWLNVNRKSILFVEWWLGYSIEGIEPRLWSCEDN